MSRISYQFICLSLISTFSWGQQKSNDFTKRMGNFDGKLNLYSGKLFMNSKLNSKINNRIRIEEWPAKYSPYGGKRFATENHEGLIQKRVDWQKLTPELPLQERKSKMANERIMESDIKNRTPATKSVEFRDAVYAQLDKRVDDWLNKVNNVSLQEINRYQFRKGRPSEPGFPVQQAGSGGNFDKQSKTRYPNSIKTPLPKQSSGSSYWLGPRKVSVQGAQKTSPKSNLNPTPKGGYRSASRPILGPKKVRVQLGAPQ